MIFKSIITLALLLNQMSFCEINSCEDNYELDQDNCKCVESCLNGDCLNIFLEENELPQDFCGITCPPGTLWEFPCQCVDKESSTFLNNVFPDEELNLKKSDENNDECFCVDKELCKTTKCEDFPLPDDLNELPQDYCNITCPTGTVWEFPCQCVDNQDLSKDSEDANSNNSNLIDKLFPPQPIPQDYCGITCPPGTLWEFPCQCVKDESS